MRKGLCFAVVLAIASSLVVIPASAAVKTGGTCPKLNQLVVSSGLTFTCTKVGKKLMWGKGVKVMTPPSAPVAVPSPAPAPIVIPDPLPALTSDSYPTIAATARNSILSTEPAGDTPISINYQFNSDVPVADQNLIKEGANNFISHFSHIMNYAPKPFGIIGWSTKSVGEPLVKAYDPASADFQNDMTSTFGKQTDLDPKTCTGMGGFSVGYERLIVIQTPCTNLDDSSADVATHELTHEVQASVNKGVNPRAVAPVWMVEGQAQVVGAALSVQNGADHWFVGRATWVERIPKNFTIQDITAMEGETSNNPDPAVNYAEYTAGGALEEYLIAKFGFQKSLDIYQRALKIVPQGTPSGAQLVNYFKIAFQQVFGQTLDSFYAEALPYINYLTTISPTASSNYSGTDPVVVLNEGCHSTGASATLQQLNGSQWVDVASKMGWDIPLASANCATGMERPWTAAKVAKGTVLRWHVFSPGNWDWYSTQYTY